jgi:hypothetical protein
MKRTYKIYQAMVISPRRPRCCFHRSRRRKVSLVVGRSDQGNVYHATIPAAMPSSPRNAWAGYSVATRLFDELLRPAVDGLQQVARELHQVARVRLGRGPGDAELRAHQRPILRVDQRRARVRQEPRARPCQRNRFGDLGPSEWGSRPRPRNRRSCLR